MLAAKIFLWFVGVSYAGLSLWCVVLPAKTSEAVGFRLSPGSGQSEYLAVYGGLQAALAVLFLAPAWKGEWKAGIWSVLVVHLCLVLFRTPGFFLYNGISSTTKYLAGAEWALLLLAIVFYRKL